MPKRGAFRVVLARLAQRWFWDRDQASEVSSRNWSTSIDLDSNANGLHTFISNTQHRIQRSQGCVRESDTQTIRLEDIEVETFGVLVHWMYTKEIKDGLGTFINDKGAPDFDFVTLAKVWKLAERALMPLLQDAITAELFKKRDTGTIESLVKFTKFFTASEGISRLKGFAILHILWERKDDQLRFLIPRLPRHILNLVGCGFDEFFFFIDGAIDLKLKK
ncbi:hypothetical protein DL95DRAFT_402217 [Leptodontidium sp. 2 PMI_412]|nr:hypothetical protein DL95DRAFT_402217 [Leptodontidium sp. 2 PMI_412]